MDQEMNNVPNNEPAGVPQVAPEQVMTEQVTVAEAGPVVLEPEKPKKKSNGMLLGLILCLLLAAGGIGFGVWTMMDGNSQKDALNSQIADFKKRNSELMDKISELNEKIADLEGNNDGKLDGGDVDGGESVNNDENVNGSESTSNENISDVNIEIINGVFYVKDSDGNVLARSRKSNITELVSCDDIENGDAVKCSVATSDGSGWFVYNKSEETLTSSFDAE